MKHALPPLTPALVEAFAASAQRWLGWLLDVVLSLGARRSRRLHRFLEACEREVECILFLKAVLRFGPPPPRRRRIPRSAPPGFRRARGNRLCPFLRAADIRARGRSYLERVLRLFDALARPERHVAHFFRCLCNGLRGHGLIAVAPRADACGDIAVAQIAFADTS